METIDRIRAFNRFYTERMGLLDRSYLNSGLTVTDVRVLYDLAHHGPLTARAMASGLRLDQGYLSRILGRFAGHGWLARQPDPTDGRAVLLSLTPAGLQAFGPLESRSRDDIAAVIAGLDVAGRIALQDALARVRTLLTDPPPVILRDLQPGDAGWVVMQHGALYARDEGYDSGFEALVAGILFAFLGSSDPTRERGWIAAAGDRRLGCIFCVRVSDEVAKLRLFLLLPEARGLGLGRQLLDACTGFARAAAYRRMVLWTHESHRAATALYARDGWRMTSATPTQAFGQAVVNQEWVRDL